MAIAADLPHTVRDHTKPAPGLYIVHCYRGFNLAGIVERHKINNDQASQSSTEVLMKSSTGIP